METGKRAFNASGSPISILTPLKLDALLKRLNTAVEKATNDRYVSTAASIHSSQLDYLAKYGDLSIPQVEATLRAIKKLGFDYSDLVSDEDASVAQIAPATFVEQPYTPEPEASTTSDGQPQVGDVYGRLTVVQVQEKKVLARCECKNEIIIRTARLAERTSCGNECELNTKPQSKPMGYWNRTTTLRDLTARTDVTTLREFAVKLSGGYTFLRSDKKTRGHKAFRAKVIAILVSRGYQPAKKVDRVVDESPVIQQAPVEIKLIDVPSPAKPAELSGEDFFEYPTRKPINWAIVSPWLALGVAVAWKLWA